MPSLSMVFDLLAIDRASAVFDRVGGSAANAGREVEAASGSMASAGSKMAAGLGLATAAVAVFSAKLAGDYQQQLTKLATTAGAGVDQIGALGQGMLDMAGQVGIGAQELAQGMYTVESSLPATETGAKRTADALTILKASAQGARQESADLGKVADAVSTALHDYNLPASDAAKVTSQMVTAVSSGKTTFDELTGSLHSVTPLAAALHVPFADIIGSLAAMTASGESADQATQNMADALRHLQAPTKPMIDELAQLGITASDLGSQLGTKGLSGTIQEISQAILQHMGPSGQVLLGTFNQSKISAQDAATMYDHLPPSLQKVADAYSNGSLSVKDWRDAVKAMPADQQTLATSWKNMQDNANGFTQALKSGKPDAQEYTAALQKAMGTSAGLTVALQLTGEHTDAVNESIKKIAASAGDASGNIKGWDEVQGNFNQQLAQAGASVGSMAIQLGQNLLPALTGALGWVNSTGVPALENLGGAVSGAVRWFMQLPGPVKEAAVALGIVKVLGSSDMFAGLLASGRVLAVGFANDMSNMVTSARAGAGQMTAAFAEAKAAQRELAAARFGVDTSMLPKATGDIAGLGAAAGAAAKGGFAALKSGASGLMGLFGGPWGVALIGATVGVFALQDAIKRHDESIKKATDDVLAWNKAVSLNPGGSSAVQAQQNLANLQKQYDDVTTAIHNYNGAANGDVSGGGVNLLISRQKELAGELEKGKQAWQDQLAAMTPVEEMQARVDAATKDLNDALKNNPSNSSAVTNASMRLEEAQHMLAVETINANNATKTQAQLQQDAANAMLGSLDAARVLEESQLQLTDAVTQYNLDVAAGQQPNETAAQYTRRLKEEQLGLVDSARRTAQAASDAAVAQDKQNGITDTAHDSQTAFLKSLQDSADQMTGPGKQAILDMIAQLGKQQNQAIVTSGAISALGVTVTDLPDEHLIHINVPTGQQMKDLADLKYVTVTLPDHTVVVSADTNPAQTEIADLLQYARTQSILFRAGLAPITPGISGGGRMGGPATGGWIAGPGTGTSDTAGVFKLSHGEFVVNAASAAQHSSLLEAINGGSTVHTSGVPVLPGYAAGGWVGPPGNGTTAQMPVHIDQASLDAMRAGLRGMAQDSASAFTGGGGGGGNPAIRALGQQIAANLGWASQFSAIDYIFTHESGWNPNAQNPTSTAYGIPQFLNSTWAAYGGKTSSPGLQITDGIRYMTDRYGSPNNAAAFWQSHHWYHDGGVVTGAPGANVPAVLKVGETVRTAKQEAALGRSAPLIHVEHVGDTVDLDLIARQMEFRQRTDGAVFG